MKIPLYCFESIDRAHEREARARLFHRRLTAFLCLLLFAGVLLLCWQVDQSGGWGALWR